MIETALKQSAHTPRTANQPLPLPLPSDLRSALPALHTSASAGPSWGLGALSGRMGDPVAGHAMAAAAAPYPPRAPKAPPPHKAAFAAECQRLEQLPNIGPSIAANLRCIGIEDPAQLAQQNAWLLYQRLCEHSGQRQDPCVLDTFMAAIDFMCGAAPLPWWHYTAQRKARYGALLKAPA